MHVFSTLNQSVEKAVVAFVKGANERNEFFEKNKQSNNMTNTSGQMTYNPRDELIWEDELRQVTKVGVSLRQ